MAGIPLLNLTLPGARNTFYRSLLLEAPSQSRRTRLSTDMGGVCEEDYVVSYWILGMCRQVQSPVSSSRLGRLSGVLTPHGPWPAEEDTHDGPKGIGYVHCRSIRRGTDSRIVCWKHRTRITE